MSSSTAIQEDGVRVLKVPKFIIPIHNTSSSPTPLREAFIFRDGLVIISTPISSDADLYACLEQTCRTLGIKPLSWSETQDLISSGPVTTESIREARDFAKGIEGRKPGTRYAARVEKRERYPGYFDIPVSDPMTSQPLPFKSFKHTKSALPQLSPDDGVPTTEHIEEVEVVDDRHFQDRLILNAKMEKGRKKYIAWRALQHSNTEMIDQDEDDKPEDPEEVLEDLLLDLNEEGRRQVEFAKVHMQAPIEVQIRVARAQASIARREARIRFRNDIGAWIYKVNIERGLVVPAWSMVRQTSWGIRTVDGAPRMARASANQSPLNMKYSEARRRVNEDWNKAKLASARKIASEAAKGIEAIREGDVVRENAVSGAKPWPTKVLSRHDHIEDPAAEDAKKSSEEDLAIPSGNVLPPGETTTKCQIGQ